MNLCTRCTQVHREPTCPFCNAPSGTSRAMNALGGLLTSFVLAACYGTAGIEPPPPTPDTGDTGDTGLDTGDTGYDSADTGVEDTGDTGG